MSTDWKVTQNVILYATKGSRPRGAGLINKEMHNSCSNLSLSIEKAQINEESFAVKLPEYFLTKNQNEFLRVAQGKQWRDPA